MNASLDKITKLSPEEFIGVARLLGVGLMEEDGETPRDFWVVLSDMCDKYEQWPRKKRRELDALIRAIAK